MPYLYVRSATAIDDYPEGVFLLEELADEFRTSTKHLGRLAKKHGIPRWRCPVRVTGQPRLRQRVVVRRSDGRRLIDLHLGQPLGQPS